MSVKPHINRVQATPPNPFASQHPPFSGGYSAPQFQPAVTAVPQPSLLPSRSTDSLQACTPCKSEAAVYTLHVLMIPCMHGRQIHRACAFLTPALIRQLWHALWEQLCIRRCTLLRRSRSTEQRELKRVPSIISCVSKLSTGAHCRNFLLSSRQEAAPPAGLTIRLRRTLRVAPNRVCCNALLAAYARARHPQWARVCAAVAAVADALVAMYVQRALSIIACSWAAPAGSSSSASVREHHPDFTTLHRAYVGLCTSHRYSCNWTQCARRTEAASGHEHVYNNSKQNVDP